jgi:hypothetical protein
MLLMVVGLWLTNTLSTIISDVNFNNLIIYLSAVIVKLFLIRGRGLRKLLKKLLCTNKGRKPKYTMKKVCQKFF